MKEQSITLDRSRALRFTINSMAAIEDETGMDLADFAKMLQGRGGKLKISDVRLLLWALLVDDDPTLTLWQAGSLIPPAKMSEIAEQVVNVFADAMPEGDSGPLA